MRNDPAGLASTDVMITSHLLAHGETTKSLAGKVRSGQLVRVARGVYVATDVWKGANRSERFLAHHVAFHKGSRLSFVFSHTSAAALLGLSLLKVPTTIHITTPERTYPNHPRVRAHARRGALDEWLLGRFRLPVTRLERTALDCALVLPLAEGLVVMDQALARGADKMLIEEMAEASKGRNGAPRARRVVELMDPRAGSVAETLTRLALISMPIPSPRPQCPVRTREGTKYLDFGWEDLRLGLEVDGKAKYFDYRPTDQAVFDERHREKLIIAEGWTVLRTDWNESTREPDRLRHRLMATMQRLRS